MPNGKQSDEAFWKLSELVSGGQPKEAKRVGASFLREGCNSPDFLNLIADLLDPDAPKKRGRPSGSTYSDLFMQIGEEYENMRRSGVLYADAILSLASKYPMSERSVEKLLQRYKAFWVEADYFSDAKDVD